MATKTEETKAPSTELAPQLVGGVPAELLADAAEMAGAGVSSRAEDVLVPFVGILQDGSPEIQKRKSEYIDGAEPGMILVKQTGQLFAGDTGLLVQPCAFEKCFVEWVPRDAGGGFRGRHQTLPDDVEEIPDPRGSDKKILVRKSNGNEIIDTRYHYLNLILGDGIFLPAVMGFSATFHSASRAWMMLQNMARLPDPKKPGMTFIAPSFFKQYRLTTKTKKNAQGEWFVPHFDDAGWIADANLRAMGKMLYQSVASGEVTAAADTDDSGVGNSDLPI